MCMVIVALLPKSINKQKKTPLGSLSSEAGQHGRDEGERRIADSHSTVDNTEPTPTPVEEDTEIYL